MELSRLGSRRASPLPPGNRRPIPPLVLLALVAMGLWALAYQLTDTVLPGLATVAPFDGYWDDVIFFLAGLMMVARGWRGERGWLLLGLGSLCWASGDFYWTSALSKMASPPVPSWADAGYLAFVPLAFLGILSLVRGRLRSPSRLLVADAAATALATAAVSAAIVIKPVLDHISGGTLSIATNLAYPVGDLALLGLLVGATALDEWRISRTWLLLAVAIVAFWIADSFYLTSVATDSYSLKQWYNGFWYLSPVVAAWAAWVPAGKGAASVAVAQGTRVRGIAMLIVAAITALTIVVWSDFQSLGLPAIVLASGALIVIMIRLQMTWRENMRLLRLSQDEAITDALTGLRNRRALVTDLDLWTGRATVERQLALVLFDLDGFKHYNDSFGHPAGDALLQRLGSRLAAQLTGVGTAYRMGGDEFCALITAPPSDLDNRICRAAAALSESGEGFVISCSYGAVVLPVEVQETHEALRLADQRMYAQKRGNRISASRQSGDVLLTALAERNPELRTHLHDVAELAAETARSFGLPPEEVEQIRQAAELHDVGKMAIPDAILEKPAPLDDSEWEFIRRHTLIGERIINAAPALHRVASLVRSSHENFDGSGYPDSLESEQIPLGARIIAVCDAFDAMTTNRSYRKAMRESIALAELRRCAGTQFDPLVVDRFCAALQRSREQSFAVA